ncbi:MAG: ComF family protein [Asticcacaulis sp.]
MDDHLTLSHVRSALGQFIDMIFPPHHFDRSETAPDSALPPLMGAGMAAASWANIRFLERDGCEMCARPFEGGLYLGAGSLCSACTQKPFPFRRGRAACLYDDASKPYILGFKHGDRLDLTPMLTRWLERTGADIIQEADIIMPVPLHRLRLFERRYNQAAELARPLARHMGRTYMGHVLQRIRMTKQQGKSAQARWDNVKNAFAVRTSHQKQIAGKRIVLIDDVFTTGATLRACSQTLLAAGAASVDICVLARAVKL